MRSCNRLPGRRLNLETSLQQRFKQPGNSSSKQFTRNLTQHHLAVRRINRGYQSWLITFRHNQIQPQRLQHRLHRCRIGMCCLQSDQT